MRVKGNGFKKVPRGKLSVTIEQKYIANIKKVTPFGKALFDATKDRKSRGS